MSRRILIYPGFHQTGSRAVDRLFWENRARLAPNLCVLQHRHLEEPARMCERLSAGGNPLLLSDLVGELETVLAAHGPGRGDGRDIIISCARLSGHCPGFGEVMDYSTAPFTATVLAGYFAETQPEAEVMVVYTTREAKDWLWRAWLAGLAAQRLTDDFDEWSAKMAPVADFSAVVTDIAGAVRPAQVFAIPVEEAARHPQGPGGSILELLPLPDDVRAALAPSHDDFPMPDEALSRELLWLNRSNLGPGVLRTHKAKMLKKAGLDHWGAAPARPG